MGLRSSLVLEDIIDSVHDKGESSARVLKYTHSLTDEIYNACSLNTGLFFFFFHLSKYITTWVDPYYSELNLDERVKKKG